MGTTENSPFSKSFPGYLLDTNCTFLTVILAVVFTT